MPSLCLTLADGSCLCSSGSTHVLATVVCNTLEIKRTEDGGLPLQVDYSEGAYARGQVPDHASKRDRQGDREVLISRAMDRALRPLFRPGFSYETHVCAQALSRGGSEVDDRDAVEAMAINSASAAIMSSRVISSHFAGPIGAVLVVKGPDGRFVVSGGSGSQESQSAGRGPSWLHGVDSNSNSQTVLAGSGPDYRSKFRLLYAGTADKAVMVEMEADQASGLELVEAMSLAQSCVADIVEAQLSIAASARKLDEKTNHSAQAEGKEGTPTEEAVKEDEMGVMFETLPVTIQAQGEFKRHLPLVGASRDTVERVEREGKELIMAALERGAGLDKAGRSREVMRIKHKLAALTGLTSASTNKGCGGGESDFDAAFDIILSQCMRELCIVKGLRVDGRALDEIRPLLCDPSPLPSSFSNKVHGSALFGRGETRSLCMAAVGNLYTDPVNLLSSYMTEEQRVKQRDNLMLHYEFPPWATHETGMVSGRANRREVGHGALALKALRPLMPDFADFSFLTRIVAKTTSSNGSSSMAAVCGGSLALKMAGVPIAGLVAGISVGLLSERWPAPLTSISGGAEGRDQEPWPQEMGLHSDADDGNGLYQPASGNGCNYGRQSLILDIQGMEDGMGDMDLKVAGTRKGLTAIQLDIKLPGIPLHLLNEGIKLARSGLEKILDQMEATISKQSDKIDPSILGPQHKTHQLTPDLIVPLVGEKGESIASLQERSGAVISAKVDGEVQVQIFAQLNLNNQSLSQCLSIDLMLNSEHSHLGSVDLGPNPFLNHLL